MYITGTSAKCVTVNCESLRYAVMEGNSEIYMEDFKYQAIVDWAKRMIEQRGLTTGDRFYSETELCDMHNVSRQTVRQALALMESEGVVRRKQGSGTFVQSPMKEANGRVSCVGLVSTYFSDYIFPSIVTGIESVLADNSVTMQMATTRNLVAEEAWALRTMLAQNVRGLIVEPSKSALPNPNSALFDEIRAKNIPLVFFNAKYPNSDFPCIAMDDVAAGYTVTEHLVSLGHRKISAMLVFDDIQGHKRYQGFMKCLIDNSIPSPEQRVMWFPTQERPSLFTLFEERVLKLLKESTAIVCYNDMLAVGLVEFCKQKGIAVPQDVSIVGIDDSNQAQICELPLTTVRHPQKLLGEKAAEVLLRMMADSTYNPGDILFTPKLVERESAAAVNEICE